MIEDGNLFDLREQSLIDLLHIRSGQRARLAGGEDRESTNRNQKQLGHSPHELSVLRDSKTNILRQPSYRVAAVPCQAVETFRIRSTASCNVAVEEANEKRTKSVPASPKAAPGMAATPASSSRMRQSSSALIPVSEIFTQA